VNEARDAGSPDARARSLDCFVDYLRQIEGRDESEAEARFAGLCQANPGIAKELSELRKAWEQAAEVHDRLTGGLSLFARLNRRFGADIDPGVSLDPEDDPDRPRSEMLSAAQTRRIGDGAAPAGGDAREQGSDLFDRLRSRSARGGRYRLQEEIGRGGMGVVVRIWDEELRRHLAMKILRDRGDAAGPTASPANRRSLRGEPSAPTVDTETLVRFLEEAQITSQLRHPGIVPVHELGLDLEGRIYFTMHLVRGNTFREVIEWAMRGENGWTPTRALHVLVDVCDALGYAHSKGVIHRDMKPSNVMVGRYGETYVMDWGLARVLGKRDRHDVRVATDAPLLSSIQTDRRERSDEHGESPIITMDGAVVGTPAYMPPEQANGRIELIDRRADVYSVGAMLYHLLTGQPPYVGPGERTSPRTVLAMVKLGPPKRVHELAPATPAELEAICEKAMARDPARRYADLREFAEDLRAYLENRVVKAHARGALVELRKWVARNRATAAACAATLVVALAGAALVAVEKARSNREISGKNEELRGKNEELARTNADLDRAAQQLRRANVDLDRAIGVAREEKLAAERHLSEVQRLSDLKRLRDLREEAARLWPAWPDQADAMRAWIGRARELGARLDLHRGSLRELRRGGTRSPDDAEQWRFDDGERQWWHDTLAGLVRELELFTGGEPRHGTIAEMERRLALAESTESASIDEHLDEWNAAIAAIARHPAYGGLVIREQMGLVPLGANPRSKLWEFWLVESGTRPVPEERSGRFVITPETGMVLVLLPGGTFRMGAEPPTPERPAGSPNVDPNAVDGEHPVHDVVLAPFFLSRYEMTQGQWVRQTGANPSWFRAEGGAGLRNYPSTCPVENVTWEECARTLAQLGLALPTEAQWEYAARGGTRTIWWTGDDLEPVGRAANLADRTFVRADGPGSFGEEWGDTFAYVAPVGEFRPNPFGLHDVHGNVWEWCQDEFVHNAYFLRPRDGDGLVARAIRERTAVRVLRGGSWARTAALARSALRSHGAPDHRKNDVGVRPARTLRD